MADMLPLPVWNAPFDSFLEMKCVNSTSSASSKLDSSFSALYYEN